MIFSGNSTSRESTSQLHLPPPSRFLRLAITGHRDLLPDCIAQVREALAFAISKCARLVAEDAHGLDPLQWSSVELTLISALAEGADQLAVEVFRETSFPEGVKPRFEAVLPFDINSYATTMSPSAAAQMRRLGELADSRFVLADGGLDNLPDEPGNAEYEKRRRDEKRWSEQRYAIIGDILVRQADLLLAVWNGGPSGGPGGTASVMANALREGVPIVWIHATTARTKLVQRIGPFNDDLASCAEVAIGIDGSTGLPELRAVLAPALAPEMSDATHEHDPDSYARSRAAFDTLFDKNLPIKTTTRASIYQWFLWSTGSNIEKDDDPKRPAPRTWSRERMPEFGLECAHVDKDMPCADFADVRSERIDNALIAPWAALDALATRLSHHYRSAYVATFVLGALAVLVGLIGLIHHEHKHVYVTIEIVLLMSATSAFWWSRRRLVHERFLLARGLAEQFRSGWVLAHLGLGGRRVIRQKPATWTAWLLQAWIGAAGLPHLDLTRERLGLLARLVRMHIVQGQLDYHRNNARRLELLHHALEATGKTAFLASPWAGLLYILHHYSVPYVPDIAPAWLALTGAGFPAVAAAAAGLRYQGDYLRFAMRSRRTALELTEIDSGLERLCAKIEAGDARKTALAELRAILIALEAILNDDLEDWRYVYSVRGNPDP